MFGRRGTRIALLALCAGAFIATACLAAAQEDRTTEIRDRFTRESDPVRKAKILGRLGDAEFQEITEDFHNDRLREAAAVLRQYRDEALACRDALDARNVDVERHPAGYKELQFSLRESMRRLEDLMVSLTEDDRTPFAALHKELMDLNHQIIHKLFPRQPGAGGREDHYHE